MKAEKMKQELVDVIYPDPERGTFRILPKKEFGILLANIIVQAGKEGADKRCTGCAFGIRAGYVWVDPRTDDIPTIASKQK